MSLDSFKNINFCSIFLLLSIVIFLGIILNPVSAATINVSSGLQNYDIQSLIDGAQSGDTINFMGNSYSNISLIINKKLNIISHINTIIRSSNSTGINGSNMGLTETFAFYFAKNSSGSVISGFNILTNSDYGIIAQNAKNITISSNNISGGYKGSIKLNNISNVTVSKNGLFNSKGNGINIENSKKITVNENQISNNTYSGIHVYNSESINVKKNNVSNNTLSGISIYSSKNVSVKGNNINKNGYGVYLSGTDKVNVSYNKISNNRLNGITLEDTTKNTYISKNNVTGNLNGLYIDSYSVNDTVCNNYFTDSHKSIFAGLDVSETGNGIIAGTSYQESNSLIKIEDNSITNNEQFSIRGSPALSHDFVVGANWYGTNDPSQTHVCPMVGMCGMLFSDQVGSLDFVDEDSNKNNQTGGKTNSGNGSSIGNGNGTMGGNNNGSFLGSGSGTANGNGTGSGIGLFGNLESNGLSGGSSGGKNGVEVSIKNTLNAIKSNPYASLGILAIIVLIAVGYFKRDKFN
jgi:parallel beta-helix repeat protein